VFFYLFSANWYTKPFIDTCFWIVFKCTVDLQLWDGALVQQLSSLPNVRRVVSIGTLCAVELVAQGPDAGYDMEPFIII
jgi:hypothetical protein